MNDRFLSMCGMARRAGAVIIGTNMVTKAVRGKVPPRLVILSFEASDNTKKRITDSCAFHEVELLNVGYTLYDLGKAVGQSGGAACIALKDEGFSKAIMKIYTDSKQQNNKDSIKADSTGSQEVK